MTIKCVRVIVDNFERLPAHDATSGLYVCSQNGDDHGDRRQDESKDGVGECDVVAEVDASIAGQNDAVGGGSGGADAGGGEGEAKAEKEDEHRDAGQQKERQGERRVIPAKFLQLISAGLSTDLDPKVWMVAMVSTTCVWLVVVFVTRRGEVLSFQHRAHILLCNVKPCIVG